MRLPSARLLGYRIKAGLGAAMFSSLVGGMIGSLGGVQFHNTLAEWTFVAISVAVLVISSWNDDVPPKDS